MSFATQLIKLLGPVPVARLLERLCKVIARAEIVGNRRLILFSAQGIQMTDGSIHLSNFQIFLAQVITSDGASFLAFVLQRRNFFIQAIHFPGQIQ